MTKETANNQGTITQNESNNPHCKHYVKRKKRYCKMTIKTGQEYCGEHLPSTKNVEDPTNKMLRIVCPLDNKHTCFAHKLAKHLKICNARPNTTIPYISKGINCGDIESEPGESFINSRQLSSVPPQTIKDLVCRINKLYEEEIQGKIKENFTKHRIVEEELQKPEYGDRTKKHLIQASSILGLLQQNDMIQNETCYIEFGAGKGQLSFWISKAIESQEKSSVLLVERASHRHKHDNKLDKTQGKVHRIRADIGDLILKKVDVIEEQSIVGVTKHLCGDATDLALRCMNTFVLDGGKTSGLIMAFCCHHRCQWSAYTGKSFFKKFGLTRADFDVMCGMVSWAICGSGQSREANKSGNFKEQNERDKEIGLTREEKEEIGKKCKNVLDYGRLSYLEDCGYQCQLLYYVNNLISPENVCVVAKRIK